MIRKIAGKLKLKQGENQKALSVAPLFVLPNNQTSLIVCIFIFIIAAFLIYLLEQIWMRKFVFKAVEAMQLQRILMWEFGTVLSIIGVFLLKQYCVVLPLLFLLAFLIMWYLIRVTRE